MTRAEIIAFNSGVATVLEIASAAASAIEAIGRRPLVEAFAVAALQQLADDGRALLLPLDPPAAPEEALPPGSPAPQPQPAVEVS